MASSERRWCGWLSAAAVTIACGTPPAAVGPMPTPTPLPDAAAAEPEPPPAEPPDAAPPEVAPAEEKLTLRQGESATTADGLTVTYAHHGHKHGAGPDTDDLQMITIAVELGGAREELELRSSDDPAEGELVAHGRLLLVTGGYSQLTVVIPPGPAPAPLEDDAAADLARSEATKAGKPAPDGTGYYVDNGILRFTAHGSGAPIWAARVGLYTRRIWFVEPPKPRKKPRARR